MLDPTNGPHPPGIMPARGPALRLGDRCPVCWRVPVSGYPFGPQRSIIQGFQEDTADNRASLEPNLTPGFCVVPVRHGNAIGGLVEKIVNGADERIKVLGLARDGGGPENPVELGVILATIESACRPRALPPSIKATGVDPPRIAAARSTVS